MTLHYITLHTYIHYILYVNIHTYTYLGKWTSIYQLFWCENPGTRRLVRWTAIDGKHPDLGWKILNNLHEWGAPNGGFPGVSISMFVDPWRYRRNPKWGSWEFAHIFLSLERSWDLYKMMETSKWKPNSLGAWRKHKSKKDSDMCWLSIFPQLRAEVFIQKSIINLSPCYEPKLAPPEAFPWHESAVHLEVAYATSFAQNPVES